MSVEVINRDSIGEQCGMGQCSDNYSKGKMSSDIFDTECFVGAEVEAENINVFALADKVPDRHYIHLGEDGSLKHMGAELKFKKPFSGIDIIHALNEIDKLFMACKDIYTAGNRGSTHLHFDVTSMTTAQLISFVCTSWIIEPYLFSLCPQVRGSTTFCVPVHKTRDVKTIIEKLFLGELHFGTEFYKYRGIGLNSLSERGSLEFRMFDTCLNPSKILAWINTIQRMRKVSMDLDFEFFKNATNLDVEGFIYQVVGHPFQLAPQVRKQTWDILRQISHVFSVKDPKLIDVGHVPEKEFIVKNPEQFLNTPVPSPNNGPSASDWLLFDDLANSEATTEIFGNLNEEEENT